MTTQEHVLREQLIAFLKGGQAHATFADAVRDFPLERAGEKPDGAPYSAWALLEHIRIALHDLLDFATNAEYAEMTWPDDYWPKSSAPATANDWAEAVRAVASHLQNLEALVQSSSSNLFATIPWGKNKETLLRTILLAADHTSYHIGELILLRKLLGAWKK